MSANNLPRAPSGAGDEHEFHVLGSRRFEHLARALHGAEPGISQTRLYGPDGQRQWGADHVAYRHENGTVLLEVGQSKAYKRFAAAEVRKAVTDFTTHWDPFWRSKSVRRFILFVGCVIKSAKAEDEIIAQARTLADLGVEFEVWDASTIYDKLGSAPGVVRVHLGQDWYSKLFGEPVGPLTGLQRDLQRGDRSALMVGDYVARLNQAEVGALAELRRRARRGHSGAVIEELEDALFRSRAADAAAPETKAGQMRLLAGLLIHRGEHQRVRRLLDDADALDGDSRRLRAVLELEETGPEAVLAQTDEADEIGVVEARAVAHLRLGQPEAALRELARFLSEGDPPAEALRIAAFCELVRSRRAEALVLAERAVARDPDSRACLHAVGVMHYHMGLSPKAVATTGEWPEPVEQPLVSTSDEARAHLEEAERAFARLKADPLLDDHRSMVMWHFGALANMSWRRSDAERLVSEMQAAEKLPTPLIAWCIACGLEFDEDAADGALAAQLVEAPEDLETLLLAVGLATFRRDLKRARRLLESRKGALIAAGHHQLYAYWTSVLDIESRQEPSTAAADGHPRLRFRQAMRVRPRKKRLAALESLLERELERNGDARVVLACSQLLLEGGWYKTVGQAASFLIDGVGTAEAIGVAVRALYLNRRCGEVVEALKRLEIFPGKRLPADLERVRAECLAVSGEIVQARRASLALAQETGQERDIWRSIEFHLASGDEKAALTLYDQHEDVLATPVPGHVLLARAIMRSRPDAASRITRRIAPIVPDEMVTAVFELAAKLKLAVEQRSLIARIVGLGNTGSGGVQMLHFNEVVEWIKQRNEHIEDVFEKYANGHLPVHVLGDLRQSAPALTHLGPILTPPAPGARLPILSTRYGRRYDEAIWPEEVEDVTLIADFTALLTAQGLDLLDTVERAFKPIRIALDTTNALLTFRADLPPVQRDRTEATLRVLALVDGGDMLLRPPGGQLDAYSVLWELEGREPAATLNLSRLMESILPHLPEERRTELREELGSTLSDTPSGAVPPAGSVLNLDRIMAVTLETAGALAPIIARFRVTLEPDEVDALRAEIADVEARERIASSIEALSGRIGTGLSDGTYQTVPFGKNEEAGVLKRSLLQVIEAVPGCGGILWIDDRFTSAINTRELPVVTTVEVLSALERYGRIKADRKLELRRRLRAARWQFLPISAEELVGALRSAVRNGEVVENEELAALRRGSAEILRERRRLQWPDPTAATKGATGEIPFLLDTSHAVTQALAAIWEDDGMSVADASAASEWLLDHVDYGLFPLFVLPAGDPRSDQLIGSHLGGLILTGLQIKTGKPGHPRQAAFLEWMMEHLVRGSIKVRPAVRPSLEQMIEGLLTGKEGNPQEDRYWKLIGGTVLNAMPEDLRSMLFSRPGIRAHFDLPDHGQLTIGSRVYDEITFWRAVAATQPANPTRVEDTEGKGAELRVDASRTELQLSEGDIRLSLDPWPWLAAQDEPSLRRRALEAQAHRLDMSPVDRDALEARLAALEPVERIRHLLSEASVTAIPMYEELEGRIERRSPFKLTDLLPERLDGVIRMLRLDRDVDEAAAKLIADLGLAVALRRLGGLPIKPPSPLASAIQAMSEGELRGLIEDADLASAGPWTRLFLANALLSGPGPPAGLEEEIREWVDEALAEQQQPLWRLYVAIAQLTCRELVNAADAPGETPVQQLAACWLHASMISEIIGGSGITVDSFIEYLNSQRFSSPRQFVETVIPFTGDRADPRRANEHRIRVYAAAPALAAYAAREDHRAWAHAHMRAIASRGEPRQTVVKIAEGGLLRGDVLGSFFGVDWSEVFEAAGEGLGAIFGSGLEALVAAVIAEDPDAASPWPFVRFASGEAALPTALAEQARRAVSLPLVGGEDVLERHHVLLSLIQVAVANGWTDLKEPLDRSLHDIESAELPEGDAQLLPLEIAIHHAMLEQDPLERTKALGRHLARLAGQRHLVGTVEQTARHFARHLSGQQTEAFVDVLAQIRCRH